MDENKRTCLRCGTEMLENCYIIGTGGRSVTPRFDIKQDTGKLFPTELGDVMFGLCPKCGEISWYLKPVYLEDLKK